MSRLRTCENCGIAQDTYFTRPKNEWLCWGCRAEVDMQPLGTAPRPATLWAKVRRCAVAVGLFALAYLAVTGYLDPEIITPLDHAQTQVQRYRAKARRLQQNLTQREQP